jgi:hypothetical protein
VVSVAKTAIRAGSVTAGLLLAVLLVAMARGWEDVWELATGKSPEPAGWKACATSAATAIQFIFRLLLQQFGAMIGETTNCRHPAPATAWRVTEEAWLHCQGLITALQNHKPNG